MHITSSDRDARRLIRISSTDQEQLHDHSNLVDQNTINVLTAIEVNSFSHFTRMLDTKDQPNLAV